MAMSAIRSSTCHGRFILPQGRTTDLAKCACIRLHGYRALRQLRPGLSKPGAGASTSKSRQARSLLCRCQKGADNQPQLSKQSVKDALQLAARSEGGYLVKIFVVSAIGAALVKFGSLASSTPFEPSAIIALSIITVPCLVYSLLLLQKGDKP